MNYAFKGNCQRLPTYQNSAQIFIGFSKRKFLQLPLEILLAMDRIIKARISLFIRAIRD